MKNNKLECKWSWTGEWEVVLRPMPHDTRDNCVRANKTLANAATPARACQRGRPTSSWGATPTPRSAQGTRRTHRRSCATRGNTRPVVSVSWVLWGAPAALPRWQATTPSTAATTATRGVSNDDNESTDKRTYNVRGAVEMRDDLVEKWRALFRVVFRPRLRFHFVRGHTQIQIWFNERYLHHTHEHTHTLSTTTITITIIITTKRTCRASSSTLTSSIDGRLPSVGCHNGVGYTATTGSFGSGVYDLNINTMSRWPQTQKHLQKWIMRWRRWLIVCWWVVWQVVVQLKFVQVQQPPTKNNNHFSFFKNKIKKRKKDIRLE